MPPDGLLIGNDLVDLREPGNIDKHQDRRFMDRVFTPTEQALIQASLEPDRLLWSLWAAKEAVYKILVQRDGSAVFAHRRFAVSLKNIQRGMVNHADTIYTVKWHQAPGYVHAIAWIGSGSAVFTSNIDSIHGRESATVRHLALKLVRQQGISANAIKDCPPRVYHHDLVLNLRISLSHDGQWAAAVLACPPGPWSSQDS